MNYRKSFFVIFSFVYVAAMFGLNHLATTGIITMNAQAAELEAVPHISFSAMSKDLGRVYSGVQVKTAFQFKNEGKSDLVIEKVSAG